ncbi:hypothetical protein B0H67DRAFT_595680 [Lasiosphaeris hirsuta]|uniref:Uncharacterized protein n=1 Tax=Lasiosphaeris hirsuta TaxID=260670 RepID=A0AA39ZPG0_9PEZI|nr:hypothetical protein B0H67DRAFT_595680 [Lasiosphaeris hirsuta]
MSPISTTAFESRHCQGCQRLPKAIRGCQRPSAKKRRGIHTRLLNRSQLQSTEQSI